MQTSTTTYTCTCLARNIGTNCEQRNYCVNWNGFPRCRQRGTSSCVIDTTVPGGFRCECIDQWYDRFCHLTTDPCYTTTGRPRCRASGTEECLVDANSPGGFDCECKDQWFGRFCHRTSDVCFWRNGRPKCIPFSTSDCVADDSSALGFTCTCNTGFTGGYCHIDTVNRCESNPCQNGGRCYDHWGRHFCRCARGYYGTNCQFSFNSRAQYQDVPERVVDEYEDDY